MKYVVSLPKDRDNSLIRYLEQEYDKEAVILNESILDEYSNNTGSDTNRLKYLGEEVKLLADADFLVLAHGWTYTRQAEILKECAIDFEINILYECIFARSGNMVSRMIIGDIDNQKQ